MTIKVNVARQAAMGICAAVLVLGLSACEKKGPAERAGENLDQAAESVKDAGEKAKDEIKEAGDKVQEAVK